MYRWCRRCTVVTFAVVVFGTVITAIILARIYTDSDSVKQLVMQYLSRMSPNGGFDSKNTKVNVNHGLTIQNFDWWQTDAQGVKRQIVSNADVTVRTDNRRAIAEGRLNISKMTLADPTIKFHFDKNGRCAAFSFRNASDETQVRDPIALEIFRGSIEVTFESPSAPTLKFTDVSGKIDFEPNSKVGVDLKAFAHSCRVTLRGDVDMKNKQAKVASLVVDGAPLGKLLASLPPSMKGSLPSGVFALGKANLSGAAEVAWRDDQPQIAGRMTAMMIPSAGPTLVRSANLAGSFDAKSGVLEVQEASLVDADLAAALPLVPEQHRGKIASPETLRGKLQVSAKGKVRTKEQPFGWEGKATAELKDVAWSPPQSPFPITGASATIEVTPAGLMVKSAEATVGPTTARAAGVLPDWDARQARLEFSATNVPFVKEIRDRLPERQRELWDKFQPEGSVSVTGEAAMNGDKPRFVGRVVLQDNAACYEKFPYRIAGAQGVVEFKPDGRIEIDAVAPFGGGVGKLVGTLSDCSPTSEMELTIAGSDVTIDDDLRRAFDAIKPAAEAIRKVHVIGKGKGVVTLKRRQGSRTVRVDADVDLDLRKFHADWFPYPIDHVTGRVVVHPDRVEFLNVLGKTRAGATVQMKGWSQRDGPLADGGEPTGRSHLRLEFLVTAAPLDATLKNAIPPEWHSMWDHLRPEGTLSLTATFDQPPGQKPARSFRLDASQAAITPSAFPYRLHNIEGAIHATDCGVAWKGLVARHGDVEWHCGKGEVKISQGAGELHFDALSIPELPIDPDLKAAVPANVRSVLDFLSPNVPAERVNLENFTVNWSGDGAAPKFEIGQGKATFSKANLAPAIGAKNVTGEITLSGFCNDSPDFKGNVYLHSITLADMKATGLQSQLAVRGPKIEFNGLKADFYGGKVHGVQLHAVVDPVPEYEAQITVMNANLRDYVRQTMNTEMPLNAEVFANLRLHGKGQSIGRLRGAGSIDMHQVDVLRLPILLDQLAFLLKKLPEGKTFDHLHADFDLDGTRMLVNQLKMSSSAGAFALQRRDGLVDLSTGRLDLDMVYELTRGVRVFPFTNLTALHVGGTFSNPEVKHTPVNGIRKGFSFRK
jgi:hypothetical protein